MSFKIPVLPKNLENLEKNKEIYSLGEMKGNIFHEAIRRKRWNVAHRGFEKAPEWFFEKDVSEHTPLMKLLESAAFDVIEAFTEDFMEGGPTNDFPKMTKE